MYTISDSDWWFCSMTVNHHYCNQIVNIIVIIGWFYHCEIANGYSIVSMVRLYQQYTMLFL